MNNYIIKVEVKMHKKNKITFPNDFFSKSRPNISNEEALEDVNPIKWTKEVLSGKKKIVLTSTKKSCSKIK